MEAKNPSAELDHAGRFLTQAWLPPVRLYRAGAELRSSAAYHCRADAAAGEARILVQRTSTGTGQVLLGGRLHPIRPGQAMVVAVPGAAEWSHPGQGGPWGFTFASFTCSPLPDLGAAPVIDIAAHPALDRAFLALAGRRISGDPALQPALAYQVLLGAVALAQGRNPGGAEHRLAERIAAADGRCRIAALARQLGASHAALTRSFTARFGEPPRAYAERLRLRQACLALAQGGNAAAIAGPAGYDDPAHFGRAFRRRLGLSPGAWQRLSDALRPWP